MTRRIESGRYIPLDTVLSLPRIRILRALRFFDWASSSDIAAALDAGEHEIPTLQTATSRLVAEKLLDRRGTTAAHEYRLNDRGRLEIAAYIAKTQISELDERRTNGGR